MVIQMLPLSQPKYSISFQQIRSPDISNPTGSNICLENNLKIHMPILNHFSHEMNPQETGDVNRDISMNLNGTPGLQGEIAQR